MIDDTIRVLAGDCTVVFDGSDRETYRGRVTTIVKPDNTVLVHDVDGYQPVAWLTRADSVSSTSANSSSSSAVPWRSSSSASANSSSTPETGTNTATETRTETGADTDSRDDSSDRRGGFSLVARKGEQTLRLTAHDQDGFGQYPATAAGTPVGGCPDCAGALVRSTSGGVHCVGCGDRYGVPGDATIRDDHCECGLPRMRVERGLAFHVCLDRRCESLDEAVRNAFDREWACPACDGDLRILRRGGLLAGCENYPDCDVGFVVPSGVLDGDCGCGLPAFATPSGRRCLDATCERALEIESDGDLKGEDDAALEGDDEDEDEDQIGGESESESEIESPSGD